MKRPMLVTAVTASISLLLFRFCGKVSVVLAVIAAAAVFILYLIKPLKLRKHIRIPTACICVLLSALTFLSYTELRYTKSAAYESDCTDFTGKVISLPTYNYDYGIATYTVKTFTIGDKKASVKIILTASDETKLNLYDCISVKGVRLATAGLSDVGVPIGEYSDGAFLKATRAENVSILWQCAKTPFYYCLKIKDAFINSTVKYLNPDEAGVLSGMLFGDKSLITESTMYSFRASGVAHLLAVSGLHTTLWCSLLIALLSLFGIPEKARNTVAAVFLLCFCTVSAFTPSVIRASLMMFLILLSPFLRRRADSLNSLGFAVTLLLFINPYIITSKSFILSVSATAGVILSAYYSDKIKALTRRIKKKLPKRIVDYLLSSALVSFFSMLFTLPFSVYFFGVFSIISPLSNILTVKLAFYSMISGFVSVLASLPGFGFTNTLAIFLYKITTFLIGIFKAIITFLSSFKFASIPVKAELFLPLFILSACILLFALFLKRKAKTNVLRKGLCVLSSLIIVLSLILPLIPSYKNADITVMSAGDGTAVAVRCGTHYALINCGESLYDFKYSAYDALPACNAETLDLFLINSVSYKSASSISYVADKYKPKKTVITEFAKSTADSYISDYPSGTAVNDYSYDYLGGKINIETVDTYRMYCVIIRGNSKCAVISLYNGNDLLALEKAYGTPDILVVPKSLPATLPKHINTIIVSGGSDSLSDKNAATAREHCDKLCFTAEDGNITIKI